MNPTTPHAHNGTDSPKLVFQDAIENAPQESVTVISGTAGASYTGTEQDMINDLKDTVNDLLEKLQNVGIIK